eukprot:gnl/TRDRNA2_/TRDRNA2_34828_c0_seq1.p1 gnl/TRDRNA2_/TRDRNA2_34828_c0~~gnl/TRDRNA2_/TRDRNA2_34828_c0_seq1.p1  ORF type:complete len:235 (-),score=12.85 gnl/TRDRNA2_/TRDRNA2_34828_c0_seq1:161-865(-)
MGDEWTRYQNEKIACQRVMNAFVSPLSGPMDKPALHIPKTGDVFSVTGLRHRQDLNGCFGEVLGEDMDESGRVLVRLFSGGEGDHVGDCEGSRRMKIQPSRLLPLQPLGHSRSSPSLGRHALEGIESAATGSVFSSHKSSHMGTTVGSSLASRRSHGGDIGSMASSTGGASRRSRSSAQGALAAMPPAMARYQASLPVPTVPRPMHRRQFGTSTTCERSQLAPRIGAPPGSKYC